MIQDIEIMEMPEWLSRNNFSFNVRTVLKDSLYYPGAGFDGYPVRVLMGNIFSFVYVDYGVSKEYFLNQINNHGFSGYHIFYRQSIFQNELTPNGWTVYLPPDINRDGNPNTFQDIFKKPFCEWVIFERNEDRDDSYNPKRFSLLYLCAEGVAAYQAMYLSNNIKPKMIALINTDGFSGNWTDFRDRNKIFARSVFYDVRLLPDYIISYSGPIWDVFNVNVCTSISIWKRQTILR